MLELNAASFYRATSAMHAIRPKIESGVLNSTEEMPDGGLVVTFQTDPVLTESLAADARELCENLGLLGAKLSLMSANRLLETITAAGGFTWDSVRLGWQEVHDRLLDELGLPKVLVLSPHEADRYAPAVPLFGSEFETKFPAQGVFELDEAAKCMALSRPTAAVFHLMRVLEVAIRALARCLGIPDPIGGDRSWGTLLKAIRAAIDAKWPTVAARTSGDGAFFDALYASLDAVKNPWRNAAMHVEDKKTDAETEMIFSAIKGFLMKLASRMDENGEPKA
jgi:hypothetical protein